MGKRQYKYDIIWGSIEFELITDVELMTDMELVALGKTFMIVEVYFSDIGKIVVVKEI